MLKQAQQMQQQLLEIQGRLEKMEVEGSAGGGMVKARMNGKKDLLGISISPDSVDPADLGMLEDLVLAAVRQASAAVDAASQDQLGGLAGGLGVPGLGI